MKVFCAACGKKVPKRRLASAENSYAGWFCGTICHIQYADNMIGMFRNAEVEAEQELQQEVAEKQPWTRQILEDIDEAAAEATMEGQRPQEIVARFVGKVIGKVVPQFCGQAVDGIKSWAANRKKEPEPEPAAANPPPTEGKKPGHNGTAKNAKNAKAKGGKPNQNGKASTNGAKKTEARPEAKKPDPNNPTGEPANLDELPLDMQRMWLIRRFPKLRPDTSVDDLKKERLRLVRLYHPDVKKTGNPRVSALVNSTFDRIKAIDEELGRSWS